jgi:hypothetical protein
MKKNLIAWAASCLTILSCATAELASADQDLSGSYRGIVQTAHKPKADLILHSMKADQRDGSYLAVLFTESPRTVAVYQVDIADPISPAEHEPQFKMIPRQMSSDGLEMGISNADPTLVLTVHAKSDGESSFTITDSHSGNDVENKDPVIFNGEKDADLEWADLKAGDYRGDGYTINLPTNSLVDNQEEMILSVAPLNGDFFLRRKLHGVYMLEAKSITGSGNHTEKYPTKIAIFVHREGSDEMLLINPGSYKDFVELRRD